jgi:DNA-binding IclR family transcriptional regulator
MKKPKSDYVIQTVTHALSLLEAFEGEEELGVTDLARRLGLHKNNVFRLLATLLEKGYIEQDSDTERYRLGVRCLEIGQSNQLVNAGSRMGCRLPVHCTATGKVLLGCADEQVRQEFDRLWVSAGRLESRTRSTILDREKLFEELRTVAGQGYALDNEECAVGMRCAAAPVYDAAGRSVAALSVSGPTFRLDAERLLDRVVPAVVSAAERLSTRLGYVA